LFDLTTTAGAAYILSHRYQEKERLMAQTPSTMLPLGTKMPAFTLPSFDGTEFSSASLDGKPAVIVFMCNHCPFVKHIADVLGQKAREYEALGVSVVGINANDSSVHQADSPDMMKESVAERGIAFPYLVDESQAVAKAYQAACTPDFFLFDADHKLVYRGQFDSSRPSLEVPVTGEDLTAAVNALVAGEAIPQDQKPSVGCNIKWKPGNEPGFATM
jgi:peroxiredoxin